MRSCPIRAATWRGVRPLRVLTALTSTRTSPRRHAAAGHRFFSAATWSGVLPFPSMSRGSPPRWSSMATTAAWPAIVAAWSGVWRSFVGLAQVATASPSKRRPAVSTFPERAAAKSARLARSTVISVPPSSSSSLPTITRFCRFGGVFFFVSNSAPSTLLSPALGLRVFGAPGGGGEGVEHLLGLRCI